MRPVQKYLTTLLWACAVLAMVSVIGAGMWSRHNLAGDFDEESGGGDDLPVLAEMPAFSLLDQEGKNFTPESLRGQVAIADLIFTHCAGPCPTMTAKMAALQKTPALANVRLVSISVDPTRDTPAVLKEYAEKFEADTARWSFLTGEEDAVYALARGMLVTAMPATEKESIVHSNRFILIDTAGKIRGYYDSGDPEEMAKLQADAQQLAGGAAEAKLNG